MGYGENPTQSLKGINTMNENELNGTQIALIFGATCAATAVLVGLGLRAIQKKYEARPSLGSGKTILETAMEL